MIVELTNDVNKPGSTKVVKIRRSLQSTLFPGASWQTERGLVMSLMEERFEENVTFFHGSKDVNLAVGFHSRTDIMMLP